jgi:hypothetical protein
VRWLALVGVGTPFGTWIDDGHRPRRRLYPGEIARIAGDRQPGSSPHASTLATNNYSRRKPAVHQESDAETDDHGAILRQDLEQLDLLSSESRDARVIPLSSRFQRPAGSFAHHPRQEIES